MADTNSTVVKKTTPLDYYNFTSEFSYKILEIASLVESVRALSNEIDEGGNVYVTVSLQAIKEKLHQLASEIDSTCFTYGIKFSKTIQLRIPLPTDHQIA